MQTQLHTERLLLRLPTADDVLHLAELLDGEPDWLDRALSAWRETGRGMYAVCTRDENAIVVGIAGFVRQPPRRPPGLAEIAWHVVPVQRRRGYATEAAAAVIQAAWAAGDSTVLALIASVNVPSIGVASKVGLRHLMDLAFGSLQVEVWCATRTP